MGINKKATTLSSHLINVNQFKHLYWMLVIASIRDGGGTPSHFATCRKGKTGTRALDKLPIAELRTNSANK